MAHTAQLSLILVASLMISTTLIAATIQNKEGVICDKFNSSACAYNPESSVGLFITSEDFTNRINASQYSVGFPLGEFEWNWNEGIGYIDTGLRTKLLIPDIQKFNNIYDVTYHINNSVYTSFRLYVLYNPGIPIISDANNIILKFNDNDITIPNNYGGGLLNDFSYSYPGADKISDMTINTKYNPDLKTLEVIVNGNSLFTINVHGTTLVGAVFYGGILSDSAGLTLCQADATINPNSTDLFQVITRFAGTMLTIILWNIDAKYLDPIANIILIKTQVVGIIICILAFGRGD